MLLVEIEWAIPGTSTSSLLSLCKVCAIVYEITCIDGGSEGDVLESL
jgi:hypothetical protein